VNCDINCERVCIHVSVFIPLSSQLSFWRFRGIFRAITNVPLSCEQITTFSRQPQVTFAEYRSAGKAEPRLGAIPDCCRKRCSDRDPTGLNEAFKTYYYHRICKTALRCDVFAAGVMSEELCTPCVSSGPSALNKRLLRVQLIHQLHNSCPAECGEASRLVQATASPDTVQHMLRKLLERKSSLSLSSGSSVTTSDLASLWGQSVSSSRAPSF
jgi:hypothetical protein